MDNIKGMLLLLSIRGIGLYMTIILCGPVFWHRRKMFQRGYVYGQRHKMAGLLHLAVLIGWTLDLNIDASRIVEEGGDLLMFEYRQADFFLADPLFWFNVILGVSAIWLTATAASDFRIAHEDSRIKNVASGALDEASTITLSEMVEHLFYQCLNLVQIIYLHLAPLQSETSKRLIFLFLITSPWLIRHAYFPVNSFSRNYNKENKGQSSMISVMYRLKKYQYLLYKHWLLHGLNVSVAIYRLDLTRRLYFRVYWLGLNIAYVMEFFMQTLVKRNYLSQKWMLYMNIFLMLCSTIAAFLVLNSILFYAAILSLLLNFLNRKREMFNIVLVTIISLFWRNGNI